MGYGWHGLVWLQSSNKLSRKVSALVWISGCVPYIPADYSCCSTSVGPELSAMENEMTSSELLRILLATALLLVELVSILLDLPQSATNCCFLLGGLGVLLLLFLSVLWLPYILAAFY